MTGRIDMVRGRGLPLAGNDIDTDQILESRYLKLVTFRGIEAHVFESLRRAARDRGDAPHPFDDGRFAGASILLVGRNFGCGSSREHAPQALYRFGIRAIVGESFGEIFAGNCLSIGLPCLPVSAADGLWLRSRCEAAPETELTADIAAGQIVSGDRRIPFFLPEGRRRRFLEGSWDPLMVLLEARNLVDRKLAAMPDIARAAESGAQRRGE